MNQFAEYKIIRINLELVTEVAGRWPDSDQLGDWNRKRFNQGMTVKSRLLSSTSGDITTSVKVAVGLVSKASRAFWDMHGLSQGYFQSKGVS